MAHYFVPMLPIIKWLYRYHDARYQGHWFGKAVVLDSGPASRPYYSIHWPCPSLENMRLMLTVLYPVIPRRLKALLASNK